LLGLPRRDKIGSSSDGTYTLILAGLRHSRSFVLRDQIMPIGRKQVR
jgi:hypothetical protein